MHSQRQPVAVRDPRSGSQRKLLTGASANTRSSGVASAAKSDIVRIATTRVPNTISRNASVCPPASATSSARSTGETAVVKKKVDEILKRMLPHSIVQSYEKVHAALRTQVVVAVNGEPLEAVERDQGPLSAKWTTQQKETTIPSMATTKKKPPHPFHYARSVQYATTHPELSLQESFKTLDVSITSLAAGASTLWTPSPSSSHSAQQITKKSWRLVAETDRKIGLALYELPLGPWTASSFVVLVWTKTLDVVNVYLQLHVAEMLYCCPPRAIRILPDDVDKAHGLHSFTAAITIRDFQRVLWETECFSIEFPTLSEAQDVTSVDLLDEQSGYRDRARFITSPVGTSIATDAIFILFETAIVVDFTLWESSCCPVWGFSRLLPVATRDAPRGASDFSMSVAGEKRQLLEIVYRDAIRGNTLTIQLEKRSASAGQTTKKAQQSVFVKQITLELGVGFINTTFSTNYAVTTKPTK